MFKRTLGTVAAAAALAVSVLGTPTPTYADYPNDKTVLALVPFGAGGGTDRWARVMASVGFDFFDGGIRVQNRGGAGGTIGWKHMLDKGADGYTVIMASPTPVMAALSEKNRPFEPAKDIKVVAYYSVMKTTLMAPKGKPYDTWEGFINHLKTSDKKLTYGGTITHVVGVLQALAQLGLQDKVIPVTYSGTGKAMNDYIGGHIDLASITTSTAVTMTDKHNAIFNASNLEYPKKAKAVLGDVPNAKTLGLKPFLPPRFFGMHPDTPDDQVAAMSARLGELLKNKSVTQLIGKLNEEIIFVPKEQAEKDYQDLLKTASDNIPFLK